MECLAYVDQSSLTEMLRPVNRPIPSARDLGSFEKLLSGLSSDSTGRLGPQHKVALSLRDR